MSGSMLEKHFSYVNSLSDDIKKSLNQYTKSYYSNINTYLREGGLRERNTEIFMKKLTENISNIDTAFKFAPAISDSLTLYRGQEFEIFDTKSFTSASTVLESAYRFFELFEGCCLYVITLSPGSKILPLRHISEEPSEEEILIDRNGRFFITNTEIKQISSQSMKFIYLTYMPGNYKEIEKENDIVEFSEENEEKERELASSDEIIDFLVNDINIIDKITDAIEKDIINGILDSEDVYGNIDEMRKYIILTYQDISSITKLPPITEDIIEGILKLQ